MGISDYDTQSTTLNLMDDGECGVVKSKKKASDERRIRFSVSEDNYEWMKQQDISASQIINDALSKVREAEETNNEEFYTGAKCGTNGQ